MFFRQKETDNLDSIIDDIFKIVNPVDSFNLNELLNKVLEQRKIPNNQQGIWTIVGEVRIIEILSSYDLIITIDKDNFKLTDKGKLAKELGGFTKFIKYRQLELSALSTQRKINIGLIIIGALGIFVPILIEVSKQLWFKEPSLKQPVHIVVDSVLYHSDTLPHKTKKDTNQLHQK